MPFTQKLLSFVFELANGDRVTVSGLRASVTVTMAGDVDGSRMEASIYGLTPSLTNQLSTLGQLIPWVRQNKVIASAGDSANGLSVVYQGIIQNAWADYASMPNNAFRIATGAGAFAAVQPIPPTTVNDGFADVATIMSGLATQGNFHFENNGVQQTIAYPYYPGAVKEQIDRCAQAANINAFIDPTTNTLAIWPKGTSRGSSIQVISKNPGMILYPTWDQGDGGIDVTTAYNPSIRFGQLVQVESSIPHASQQWGIISLVHDLASMTPGGAWSTKFHGIKPGLLQVGHS
jgi:hypothetical protein